MPLKNKSSAKQTRYVFGVAILLLAAAAFIISGCSKSGGSGLHVKSPASGEKDLPVKSCYAFAVTKTFTDITGKITTAATYNFHAANYDLDAANFGMTLDKPMTSDDQMRVMFSLVGNEGTKENAPLMTGTYSAKADKYMKVETVGIVTRKGGADTKTWLDRSTLNGDVKVTSVSDDSIAGDIDVTSGETTIKGSFTAKILKRK
jgi:hypothetical protein